LEKCQHSNGQQPTRKGFGMELLTRLLPYDLDATTSVDFEKDGLRFQLQLPTEHLMENGEK